MKRNRIGRTALATMMSLAMGLGVTACSRDYTVAYVYAVSQQTGNVSAFNVDYQSGSLTQIAGSPFSSGLTNPVTLVTHPSSKFVYVIGGGNDNKIAEMNIGTDGKLYGGGTYGLPTGASFPTGAAVSPSGNFLYVTYTLQQGYSTASPGPGGLAIYKIDGSGALSAPLNQNVGLNPVAVAAAALSPYVYVLDADVSGTGSGQGQILGFTQNTTTGALTPVPGTTISVLGGKTVATGFNAGVTPSAIGVDPTSRFVYVTDKATNQLYGYTITGTTSPGTLTPMVNSPFLTGLFPVALTIDPRGLFLYTANYGANTVGTYALSPSSGQPSGVASISNTSVATGPTCVTVEPALGIYLFTSNRLDGSISGAQLDPHTGGLKAIENTPFQAGAQLSCIASAANGNHASSLVNP